MFFSRRKKRKRTSHRTERRHENGTDLQLGQRDFGKASPVEAEDGPIGNVRRRRSAFRQASLGSDLCDQKRAFATALRHAESDQSPSLDPEKCDWAQVLHRTSDLQRPKRQRSQEPACSRAVQGTVGHWDTSRIEIQRRIPVYHRRTQEGSFVRRAGDLGTRTRTLRRSGQRGSQRARRSQGCPFQSKILSERRIHKGHLHHSEAEVRGGADCGTLLSHTLRHRQTNKLEI